MTYPPQGPPSDPNSQPPGYAPGQVGPEYYQQPPQYTQPDPGQTQAYPPQPGYAPQPGYQDPYAQYGQYGPPPVAPTSKGGAGTAILIVVVLVLMIGGGVAGYLLLGGNDDDPAVVSDDATSSEEEEPTSEGGEEPTEGGDEPAPSADGLVVDALGARTPLPATGEWEAYAGPGASGNLSQDSQSLVVRHTDTWISYFEVGVASSIIFEYDPADLEGSAGAAMDAWTATFVESDAYEGISVADTEFTATEVDGRPAVLAEARISWTGSDFSEDLYEDATILIVDADGVNGWVGLASVPESGSDFRQTAVDALLRTTFEGETA